MAAGDTDEQVTTAAPARCQHCHRPLEVPVVCVYCHNVMPEPAGLDHFDRVGLPRGYDIDLGELERRYLAWSRQLHPDYFSDRPTEDQKLSLELTAGLNHAYQTLRDPFRRAEYLLSLEGHSSSDCKEGPPQGFLEEMLEVREQLAEIAGDPTSPESRQQVRELSERLGARREGLLAALGAAFAELGELSPTAPERQAIIERVQGLLGTAKYVNGLLGTLKAGL